MINKGSSGQLIVYWELKDFIHSKDDSEEIDIRKIPFIKYSFVFNLSQTTLYKENPGNFEIISCEELIRKFNVRPEIRNNPRACYYSINDDYISLPRIQDFEIPEEYYSSLFHEVIHWTGHASRLNRISSRSRQDKAVEELVAEIGSAYLCGLSGIKPKVLENQASYISGWLDKLQQDESLFITAAIQAQKATNYLLEFSYRN